MLSKIAVAQSRPIATAVEHSPQIQWDSRCVLHPVGGFPMYYGWTDRFEELRRTIPKNQTWKSNALWNAIRLYLEVSWQSGYREVVLEGFLITWGTIRLAPSNPLSIFLLAHECESGWLRQNQFVGMTPERSSFPF